MEPTSHQPGLSSPSENTSPLDNSFSTTAAHATGDSPYPTDSTTSPQPADTSLKGKLDSAVATSKDKLNSVVADGKDKLDSAVASGKEKLDNAVASGKQWLNDSGVAEQAQQLPQKAKELGSQALNKVNDLTTTQKAVIVGAIAAGVAFLLVRCAAAKAKNRLASTATGPASRPSTTSPTPKTATAPTTAAASAPGAPRATARPLRPPARRA
nr:hypothetical protein [Tanacetum cinerariifolium]